MVIFGSQVQAGVAQPSFNSTALGADGTLTAPFSSAMSLSDYATDMVSSQAQQSATTTGNLATEQASADQLDVKGCRGQRCQHGYRNVDDDHSAECLRRECTHHDGGAVDVQPVAAGRAMSGSISGTGASGYGILDQMISDMDEYQQPAR